MNHQPDPRTPHDQVRAALERRAANPTPADPTGIYTSARARADRLYRRQIGTGLAVAVLFAGALIGAVTVNHGQGTIGVSVAGPGSTSTSQPGTSTSTSQAGIDGATTSVPDETTTTEATGPTSSDPGVSICGADFFSPATDAALSAHFRSSGTYNCVAIGNTFVLQLYAPSVGQPITIGVLTCSAGDVTCLNPNTAHDLAGFRFGYLPVPNTENEQLSYLGRTDGTSTYQDAFQLPGAGSPAWVMRGTSRADGFSLTRGYSCSPDGVAPLTGSAPLDLPMSSAQVLATPIPASLATPAPTTTC
jgi:hypothetical protein